MMTDNVIVPREVVQRLILAADSYGVRYLDSDDMSAEAEELQAATEAAKDALAAAPKAEPDVCPRPLYDWMVERGIWPDDGPAEWSDVIQALNDHENELAQPEAPKAEQEPWDYAVRYRDYGWGLASDLAEDERALVLRGIPFWEVKPLYTHPAPSSDELLEALEQLVSDYESEGVTGPLMNCLRDLQAKHKGPQS